MTQLSDNYLSHADGRQSNRHTDVQIISRTYNYKHNLKYIGQDIQSQVTLAASRAHSEWYIQGNAQESARRQPSSHGAALHHPFPAAQSEVAGLPVVGLRSPTSSRTTPFCSTGNLPFPNTPITTIQRQTSHRARVDKASGLAY